MQWFADISIFNAYPTQRRSRVQCPSALPVEERNGDYARPHGRREISAWVAHKDTQCMTASAIPLPSNQSEGGFFYPLANAWDRFASEEPVNLHRSSAGYNRGDQFVGE